MSYMYETLVWFLTGKISMMTYLFLESSVMAMLDHLALIVTNHNQGWKFVLIMIGSRITNLCNNFEQDIFLPNSVIANSYFYFYIVTPFIMCCWFYTWEEMYTSLQFGFFSFYFLFQNVYVLWLWFSPLRLRLVVLCKKSVGWLKSDQNWKWKREERLIDPYYIFYTCYHIVFHSNLWIQGTWMYLWNNCDQNVSDFPSYNDE